MTLADIIRGAVGRPPWDVLDTWELWHHHNLAPTMTVCTGPQGRVLCELLTTDGDEMPCRWLYVDLGDDEPPTDRDTHDWLMDYMIMRMPETVTATATGWELIALDAAGLCDRTCPVHAIHATWTRSTCATWPLHRCVVVMDHARTSHRCACGTEWIDSRRPLVTQPPNKEAP